MHADFFFPGGLDPVLDGGPGDENAVVTPQVPTGRSIRQSVFDDQTDGCLLHTVGIVTRGKSQVERVGVEAASTMGATMFGIGNHEIDRSAGARVAQIMEGPLPDVTARRRVVATGTATAARVAAAPLMVRGRQVFHPRDSFGDIGNIVAWLVHNPLLIRESTLLKERFYDQKERVVYHFVATVSTFFSFLPR
jgi:hypothetical protein